jgi:hypothetical protein
MGELTRQIFLKVLLSCLHYLANPLQDTRMNDAADTGNPYAAPRHASEGRVVVVHQGLSLLRGFGIVCVSGVAGMVLGALVGLLLGVFAPDYYREVFSTNANPIEMGLVLGTLQGGGIGFGVGCVVILAVAISIRRRTPT